MSQYFFIPAIERARNFRHKKKWQLKREQKRLVDHGIKK